MGKKINIGLIFGGKNVERTISFQTAKSVFHALNKKKYNVFPIELDTKNVWYLVDSSFSKIEPILISRKGNSNYVNITSIKSGKGLVRIDIFFPVVHGAYGEDGSLQGMLEMLQVPYVGSGVMGSALGMDKDIQKRLLNHAGVRTPNYFVIKKHKFNSSIFNKITTLFSFPIFVKPSSLGSSIGISKVTTTEELRAAIKIAFSFDDKIVIEEFIDGCEIECSILGTEPPTASLPCEIIHRYPFYSYDAKYNDRNGTKIIILDKRSKHLVNLIQKTAINVFQLLECRGLARVDFFLTTKEELIVNEINTIPSLAKEGVFIKLLLKSGIPYIRIIDILINDGFKKKKEKDLLLSVF